MTPEGYAAEMAVELAARNADMPFDAVLMLVQKTWPPGGPSISPPMTAGSADGPDSLCRQCFPLPR